MESNLQVQELDSILSIIDRETNTSSEVKFLLSLFSEFLGGITTLAASMLHSDESVRFLSLSIMNELAFDSSTCGAVICMNPMLQSVYNRIK